MRLIKETISGRGNGVPLHTLRAQVPDPRGAVAVLHGYGDHSGRFMGLAELFNRMGLSCYLFDQRGHGRSGGGRGAVLSWDEYLDDLDLFLDRASLWHGGPVKVLFGHSMGGLVAASYLLDRPSPVESLILSSPLFALAVEVSGFKLTTARLASRLRPTLSLPTAVRPEMLSRDPAVCEAYAKDPLVHKVANSRWFTEHLRARQTCLERAGDLAVQSLLMVYGEDDPLVDPGGARSFFEAVRVPDRQIIAYPGMRHEIFNETGKEVPLADLERWLAQRI